MKLFTKENGNVQVKQLLALYPGLKVVLSDDTQILLEGKLLVNRISKDFWLYKEYLLQIVIPLESNVLPYVIDIGKHIDDDYPHLYRNTRKLCLETDTHILVRFLDSFSLTEWVSEYVEVYYFTYEYHERYGEYPFGERSHGPEGVVETYSELFCESDFSKTVSLMKYISSNPYRGHNNCPCGSGQKLRNCHGQAILRFCTDDRLKGFVKKDYKFKEDVDRYYEQLRNSEKAKRRY